MRWSVWILEGKEALQDLKLSELKIEGITSEKPKKVMIFKVILNGITKQRLEIKVRAIKYIRVMVANGLIRTGSKLNNQWHWEERDKEALAGDALRDEKEIDGKRTRKVLTRNEVITAHSLEKEPLVITGSKIALNVVGAGVVLTTDAVCLEEGFSGSWIKCKPCGSDQVIKAMILNSQVAQIVLTKR
jgi:flagella basal body P-ring formation protein FlgA